MDKDTFTDSLEKRVLEAEESEGGNEDSISQHESKDENMKRLKAYTWKKVGFVLILVTAVCLFAVIYSSIAGGIPKEKLTDYRGTLLGISTYTDELQYQPSHVSTNLGKYNAEFDIDLSDSIVISFDNYNDYTYIAYKSEDGTTQTEIILSKDIPDGLNLDDKTKDALKKTNQQVSEISDGEIMIEKAYKNLYNQGYLFVIQQIVAESGKQTFATDMLNTLSECMLFTKSNDENNFYIEFDGLGTFDLNNISVMNGHAGVYFGQDNVMRMYNFEEDKVYAYITNMNSQYMMNKSSNLELADGWNNLYYDKDKDNKDMMGYRAFAVQTTKGMYYIKVDENAPEGLEEEIIEWLGIKQDDQKLNTIFDIA